MPTAAPPLPTRRRDLRVEPFGERGEHVIKDPRSGDFFLLGEREHFLLLQLDGRGDAGTVQSAYERRFAEPLSDEELEAFVVTAGEQGMLDSAGAPVAPARPRQNILYWRKPLFDPDRWFTRLEPRLRWIWTRAFVVASVATIAVAAAVLFANREDVVSSFRDSLRWESLLLGWLVIGALGFLHEAAHGLTCKHFGGAVHEIGLFFLYFTPCFYCNVSDAWLFREKSKRLWVMLAGGWCDLLVWAIAVVIWRLAEPETLVSRVSFLVLGLSGLDSLSNFNPLLKLDGYYLLSDWKELPNLRQRALERVGAHARRILWGAEQPDPDERGRFLTSFGLVTWLFSASFLVATIVLGAGWFHDVAGAAGYVAVGMLALPAVIGSVRGLCAGEVALMWAKRRRRALAWCFGLGGLGVAAVLWRVEEYSGGSFTVRPAVRAEIRSPVAGFLQTIGVEEGSRVAVGDVIARIEVPDLDSRLAQRTAELHEVEALLRLLEGGTRPEQIAAQEGCVERSSRWRDLAAEQLTRMRVALAEELEALDQRLIEAEVQAESAEARCARLQKLSDDEVVSREDVEAAEHAKRIARARLAVAQADRRAREASGTIDAEADLAEREKELGEERSKLTLMRSGPRAEELAAQGARVDRLQAEIAHLQAVHAQLEIRSTSAGVVVTPRLRERQGEYLHEGDSVCVVEEPAPMAEVALDEEKLQRIEPGQLVRFKVRALPFETIEGRVLSVASCADRVEGRSQATITVYCSMTCEPSIVRTSMGGYARIYTGERSVAAVALGGALRLLRTEFWW